jgi:elongation factor 1 alpha-like protein
VDDKEIAANERASERMGKGSFSWAWQMDGTTEERERYVRGASALPVLGILRC